MRKLVLTTAALACLAVLLVLTGGTLIVKSPSDRPVLASVGTSMSPKSSQPNIVTDTAQIPLYPGAMNLQTVTETNRMRTIIDYDTVDPHEKILAFYNQSLLAQGWVAFPWNGGSDIDAYEWTDATSVLDYGLYLQVLANEKPDGGSGVSLIVQRWPDVNRIPVYPGATQVTTASQGQGDNKVKTTTFEASASLGDVEAFYRAKLAEAGWEFSLDESRPISIFPGLVFRSYYRIGRSLSITAQQEASGATRVQLQLQSDKLRAP